jgi:hypothetical protein
LATAQALAKAGYAVEFIRKSERHRERSADVFIDGKKWEFKAPRSGLISAIEDNLKKASRQAQNVVFDSRRMKRIPDNAIKRELTAILLRNKSINHVLFINSHGKVIEIQ